MVLPSNPSTAVAPERDNDLGPDQINLLVQIWNARRHLVGGRFAVAGGLAGRVGPAFQNVADINVRALQSGGLDDFGQQLAGPADEGLGLFIFIRPRRLADEHELGVNAADAEHDVFARGREMRAFHAGQRACAQGGERGGLFG